MRALDLDTVHALRSDVALQVARFVRARGLTQVAAARDLRVPQPTVSKIMNGRVSELSLELLIRIAVRAGLHLVLQTGNEPSEAGAFVDGGVAPPGSGLPSKVAEGARAALLDTTRRMTPEQRLDAQLRHNELVIGLHLAGQTLNSARAGKAGRRPAGYRRRTSSGRDGK
jgi:predicted XRE-type DNA-binding protein